MTLTVNASAVCGMQSAALCGRQSCLQAAFQAAVSIRDEFLGLRFTMPATHKPEKCARTA